MYNDFLVSSADTPNSFSNIGAYSLYAFIKSVSISPVRPSSSTLSFPLFPPPGGPSIILIGSCFSLVEIILPSSSLTVLEALSNNNCFVL